MQAIWINGQLQDQLKADFVMRDPGFFYGWGLFETCLLSQGKGMLLAEHMTRLVDSLDAFGWHLPKGFSSKEALLEAAKLYIKQLGCADGLLRISYSPGFKGKPVLIFFVEPSKPFFVPKPIKLKIQEHKTHPMMQHKTRSYLPFRPDLQEDYYPLYIEENKLLESCIANVCFIQENNLIVPTGNLLEGVGLKALMPLCEKEGLCVQKRAVFVSELDRFDEIFCINSVRGLILVSELSETLLSSKSMACDLQSRFLETVFELNK